MSKHSNHYPGPIDIYVGRQRDGSAYSLHPASRKLIKIKFAHVKPAPVVFIGSDTQAETGKQSGEAVWDQVAIILTGLSTEKLNELGGYRILDPANEKVVWQSMVPASV